MVFCKRVVFLYFVVFFNRLRSIPCVYPGGKSWRAASTTAELTSRPHRVSICPYVDGYRPIGLVQYFAHVDLSFFIIWLYYPPPCMSIHFVFYFCLPCQWPQHITRVGLMIRKRHVNYKTGATAFRHPSIGWNIIMYSRSTHQSLCLVVVVSALCRDACRCALQYSGNQISFTTCRWWIMHRTLLPNYTMPEIATLSWPLAWQNTSTFDSDTKVASVVYAFMDSRVLTRPTKRFFDIVSWYHFADSG